MAELVHVPLVAATDTSIIATKRFASRNNSIDPPANLLPNNNNNNNISRNNSIDPPGGNVAHNYNVENLDLALHNNNLENGSREPTNLLDRRILLDQMIRRNNGNESQITLESQITRANFGRGDTGSSSKMNPNRSAELRAFGIGVPTQQG